jgi:hypothetical protein
VAVSKDGLQYRFAIPGTRAGCPLSLDSASGGIITQMNPAMGLHEL